MKRRSFLKTCAAFVAGCALAVQCRAVEFKEKPKQFYAAVNPEWKTAPYEAAFVFGPGVLDKIAVQGPAPGEGDRKFVSGEIFYGGNNVPRYVLDPDGQYREVYPYIWKEFE